MPAYQLDDMLLHALKAVQRTAPDQFIVVVDGGDAQVVQAAQAAGAETFVTAEQCGPAVARNVGARHATGGILFFVDSDVVISADTIPHVRCAFRDETLDGLIGSYDAYPAAPDFLSQYRNLLHHFTHQQSGGEAFTFWGACGAIRREPFMAVGGYDETFPHPSIEDIELGYRLRAAGYRLELDPTLQVKHLKRWKVGNMLKTDLFRRALPWSRLLLSGNGFTEGLNIKRNQRISVALAFLLPVAVLFRRGVLPIVMMLGWFNRAFYRFLYRERGAMFVAKTGFWHWVYFLCSGLGYMLAMLEKVLRR